MHKKNVCLEDFNNCDYIDNIRQIHELLSLCGEPKNSLLAVRKDLLLYVISLLKNETPQSPDSTLADWYNLITILNYHNLIPLIYYQILQIPLELKPPKEIVDILRIKFLESRVNSLSVESQLKEIINAFNNGGISPIVLKGSAFARTLYPDPATRPHMDIDLFVLPKDMARSRTIMERIGYVSDQKVFDISHILYNEELMIKQNITKKYLVVELHWHLSQYPLFNNTIIENKLYNELLEEKYNTFSFYTLNPIDTILYLSMHMGYGHTNDIRLIWVYDVYLICKHLTHDEWVLLQKRSVEYGVRIPLEKILIMANLWMDLFIPAEFSDFSKWPSPTDNEQKKFYYATHKNNTLNHFRLFWPESVPIREKIRMLFLLMFPLINDKKQLDILKLINSIIYYCKRWLRLLKRI